MKIRFRPTAILVSILLVQSLVGLKTNAQCVDSTSFVITPAQNWSTGQTVQFEYTVESWIMFGTNWLHGVSPTFWPGWDLSTLTPGQAPQSVFDNGEWLWTDSVTYASNGEFLGRHGWFFEEDFQPDAYPSNNYGDNGGGPWTFSWSIDVLNSDSCLQVTPHVYSDGVTGSWESSACPEWEEVITDTCLALVTGIRSVAHNRSVKVLQNPSLGVFNLSEPITSYVVLNFSGQIVHSGKGTRIDLSPFPAGLYFLRSEAITLRLVKL